jgi:hypothetical protein
MRFIFGIILFYKIKYDANFIIFWKNLVILVCGKKIELGGMTACFEQCKMERPSNIHEFKGFPHLTL